MSIRRKNLVREFYTSKFFENCDDLEQFLHPEAELYWNSSAGFNKMNYSDINKLRSEVYKSFKSLRAEVSHILRDKDEVTIRLTYHVRTVENPDEEIPMAHFIAIWKIKDGKLFKGYQISQPADETPENLNSFLTNF